MATLKSEQVTHQDRTPAVAPPANDFFVKWAYSGLSGATAGANTLKMWRVPKGARLMDSLLTWSALGANTSFTIGDSFDTDRFATTVSTVAASAAGGAGGGGSSGRFTVVYVAPSYTVDGNGDMTGAVATDGAGSGYKYTCETDVLITFGNGTPIGTIGGWLYYTLD